MIKFSSQYKYLAKNFQAENLDLSRGDYDLINKGLTVKEIMKVFLKCRRAGNKIAERVKKSVESGVEFVLIFWSMALQSLFPDFKKFPLNIKLE